jgi:V/A-type H+-transporting ATPase subunit C
MIGTIFKYNSSNIKARALFGKLLDSHDYYELLEKRTVQDVAGYLKKNTSYDHLLSDVNEAMVHRGDLEKLFKTSLYEDYIKLFRFLSGKAEEFLKAIFLRYETEDLKMLFRIVYNGEAGEPAKKYLFFLSSFSSLDFKKLTASKSIRDVIDNLKGSEYFKVLSPFWNVDKPISLFDIEMALDLHYFMKISKLKDELLSGADLKSVGDIFGTEVDILNLLMIYRCKKLFHTSRELTFKYVIPYWYHLTREQLVQLSGCRDTDGFKALVEKTKYAGIFDSSEEHLWEVNSMNYLYRIYKRHLRSDVFNIGTTIAYLHLKEIDIRNIITLIEGVRYSLPKDEIRSYLIGISI